MNQVIDQVMNSILDTYQLDTASHCWLPNGSRTHFAYSDGEEIEQRLHKIVSSAKDLGSGSLELRNHITDWPSKYHLSACRSNLLRSFHDLFRGQVLEVGAGCGAITRFLGECGGQVVAVEGSGIRASIAAARCRDLDNVKVVVDSFHQLPSQPVFDVVTLIGVLEYARKYFPGVNEDPVDAMLKHAKSFLKADGILIVAIENQLGLKYFAGFGEDHIGVPMYGIEDRYQDADVVTFGRKELQSRLANAEFEAQRWWYPFPDYKLPTVLLSEHAINGRQDLDFSPLIGPALSADPQMPRFPLFFMERSWPVIRRNALAADMANSFLVLAGSASLVSEEPSWLACHFSVERRREYAKKVVFERMSKGDVLVRQEKLYPETTPLASVPLRMFLEDKPFLYAEQWMDRLKRRMTTPGWSVGHLTEWASTWFQAVLEQAGLSNMRGQLPSQQVLPGNLLDALPRNFFVYKDGTVEFIDLEWQLELPIELGFLIFRGIYLSLLSLGKVAYPSAGTSAKAASLFIQVAQSLGVWIVEADLARYCEFENDIQNWVSGSGGYALENLLSFHLDVRLPSHLFCLREEHAAERDSEIGMLQQQVEEVSTWGQSLQDSLAERDAQIGALHRQIEEVSTWGQSLQDALVERDARIGILRQHAEEASILSQSLHDVLAERAAQIGTLRQQVDSQKRQISASGEYIQKIYNSWSWKMTRPLRLLLDALNKATSQIENIATRRRLHPEIRQQSLLAPISSSTPDQGCLVMNKHVDKRDIFIWSVIDWHFRIQRPQQLARGFAKAGMRVFFLSNHFVDASAPGYRLERLDPLLHLYQINLHVTGAPAIYFAPPTREAELMLEASIARLIQDFSISSSISILQHAYWYPVAQRLPNSYRLYDCMDHHEGFGNVPEKLIEIEKDMLSHADLVVVTSSWLEGFANEFNPNVALVRNATEYHHFAETPDEIYVDPQRRKIIGYYGAIAEWFDINLVRAVATANADCLVLLVGNDTVGAQRELEDLLNITFTGEVPYARLPFYLHAFDICLLPFKVLPLTLATNPVKIYEYLSAGKAVVSIDLPEIAQFGDLVLRAKAEADFVNMVSMHLQSSDSSHKAQLARKEFAAQQTWDHRTIEFCTALTNVTMPKISVIVLTYNNLDLTKACLKSLVELTDYSNIEIIIVDNDSTDGTPNYLKYFNGQYPEVKIILNAENVGFAAGNNIGLAAASGDYLVLLNNDTVVTRGWAMTLMRHLQSDRSIGLVGPVTNNIGNEARIKTQYQDIADMPLEASRYTLAKMGKTILIRNAAFFCVMMPRSIYERCGPLSEEYGLGFFEDDDYCRRVEQLGMRIACADDVFIHHHLSASFNKLPSDERRMLMERNKEKYEGKWGQWIPHSYRQ